MDGDTEAKLDAAALRRVDAGGGEVERARVFAALHQRMFGTAETIAVGRFVVLAKLGAGAMGVVYAAYDPQLDRKVALKVLAAAANAPEAQGRLEREARAMARLRHPHVVTIHEVGTHAGHRFIAMDLVDGVTLRAWLQQGQSWREIVEVFAQAGQGLATAHETGIVHRDFKPDNVLVEHGQAKVVDFGLARPRDAVATASPAAGALELSRTGAIAGTPAYMAPEAFDGLAGEAADQFSFCASLFEGLYGVRPFAGTSVEALRGAIAGGRFERPVIARRVPPWLRRLVVRGLAVDPRERWPSMRALLHVLDRRRRRPVVAAVVVAVVAVGVGGALVGAAATSASRPEVCAREAPGLDALWNAERIRLVADAFAASDVPYAADTWSRVEPILARYAAAWRDLRYEACAATYVRHERSEMLFDAQIQCLDARLAGLDALLAAMASADAAVVNTAVAAANALPAIDMCADVEALSRALARRAAGPEPDGDPAAIAVLRTRLARVNAARLTGKAEATLYEAEALATEIDALGSVALGGEAQLALAQLRQRAGALDDADAAVRTAIERAEAVGDDALRAEAQILLVSLFAQRHVLDAAAPWIGLTRATLRRLGEPPALSAALEAQHGNVDFAAGRFRDALERRRAALAIREDLLDALDPALADAHAGIGVAQLELGELADARESLQLALELRVQALGELHPDVAHAHNQLGSALLLQGDLDVAVEHLQAAIDTGTIVFGADDAFVGRALVNLGSALAQGRVPEASIPHFERGIAILERAKGPNDILVGVALGNLGRVRAHSADPASAIDMLVRARGIHEDVLGEQHADLTYVDNNLATAYLGAGRLEDAAAAVARASSIAVVALEADHPMVAQIQLAVGRIERERGRPTEAVAALRRALDVLSVNEPRPAERAIVRFQLAQALDATGERTAARTMADASVADFDADPVEHPAYVEEVTAWLAAHPPAPG